MKKNEKKRILVVDDKASNTRLLKRYLEETNDYVVREENDPIAALAVAEKVQPHLILLDVIMPTMDGADLAAYFAANAKLKAVPIVFLTAKVSKEQVDMCGGRIGKYCFLAKPIVLTDVAACLKQHLGA